jgi:hypothetical protein
MRYFTTMAVLGLLSAMTPAIAFAQDDAALLRDGMFARNRNVSVAQRPKPEYAPITQRVGSFDVLPSVTASVEGNDNIYATTTQRASDTIYRVQPAVTASSNWARHALTAYASLNADRYASHTTEDTTDYLVGANGRIDVQHDLGVALGASTERDTEPRTSPTAAAISEHPIRYDLNQGYIEATKHFTSLRLTGRADVLDYSYDNGTCVITTPGCPANGAVVQTDRDHTLYDQAAKLEYALSPAASIFANVVVNERDYRNPALISPGVYETKRDSKGYELTVGSSFDITHIMRGDIYVGYLDQNYDSPIFKDASGFSLRGRVEYFITQLTTITLAGGRSVQDAGIVNVGSYISSTATASVDHELLRNLNLGASITYGNDDYQGYDRNDKRWAEQIGASYLLNRAVSLNLSLIHLDQDSSGVDHGPNYHINRVIASLAYKF